MAVLWVRYGNIYTANTTVSTIIEICPDETITWVDGGTVWVNRSDEPPPAPEEKQEEPELPAWRPPTTAPPDVLRPVSGDAKPVEREWRGRPSQPRPPP